MWLAQMLARRRWRACVCVYACVCLHACAFVCVHVNTSPFLAVSLSPGSGTLRGLLARALPEAHPWPTLVQVSPKRRGRQEAHHRALKLRGTGHDTSFLPCLQLPLDVAPNTRVAYLELRLDLGLNSSSQSGSSVRISENSSATLTPLEFTSGSHC